MADIDAIEMKVATARQKKEQADAAFSMNQVQDALRAYHEALMYLLGLDRNAMKALAENEAGMNSQDEKPKEERNEADHLIEKIYANMSACHIKQGNWKRALETADKAIAKNKNNYKALLRKGKALGELGYLEKAEKSLDDLMKKNPEGIDTSYVEQELVRLRALDAHKEKLNREKMKGFFSKGVKKSFGKDADIAAPPAAEVQTNPDSSEASASAST